MLKFECPSCGKQLTLKSPKAGRFSPTCSKCKEKFALIIHQQHDGTFKHKAATRPAKALASRTKRSSNSIDERTTGRPVSRSIDEQTTDRVVSSPLDEQTSERLFESLMQPTALEDRTRVHVSHPPVASQTSDGDFSVASLDATSAPSQRSSAVDDTPFASGRLGPYQLIKTLGKGGMGLVFLAKQISLDRNVALKVVRTELASNPSMMARFTREAYAAAQLNHPNVVQIYDMGDADGNCYFSMELVNGSALSDLVGGNKKLDPEQAASFVLHAARGLQCAHSVGMVHRDIKPANLLVDKAGVVKVADLGLVKVDGKAEIEDGIEEAVALSASENLTRVGATVGTFYYMAPEQAKSSIDVDHRSDIYSLGCTFYVLLTGKRPFEGRSAEEVVSKHNNAPIVAPSSVSERIPKEFSRIVVKMMAKRPEDRYQTTGELIVDLEKQLGVYSTDVFTPDESDAAALEAAATSFNGVGLAKLRGWAIPAITGGSFLLALMLMFVDWRWATAFIALPIAAALTYFVVGGWLGQSALFFAARQSLMSAGIFGWLKWIAAAIMLLVVAFLAGTLVQWALLSAVGVGLGVAVWFLLDARVNSLRRPAIQSAETLLRKMRIRGLEEFKIQKFVARYAGNHWEEFFESLFGYEAKRRIRQELAHSEIGKKKPKFRGWQDGIYDKITNRNEAIQTDREKQHLSQLEQKNLESQGIPADEAKFKASQMAAAIIDHSEARRSTVVSEGDSNPEAIRRYQREKIKAMLAEAKSGTYYKPPTLMEKLDVCINFLLGPFARFSLGCCLVIGCLLWVQENDLFASLEELRNVAPPEDAQAATDIAREQLEKISLAETKPLSLPYVGRYFDNANPLIAGLILMLSSMAIGWRMAFFVIPAAAIIVLGASFGIGDIQTFTPKIHALTAAIGIGLFVLGILFGRTEY